MRNGLKIIPLLKTMVTVMVISFALQGVLQFSGAPAWISRGGWLIGCFGILGVVLTNYFSKQAIKKNSKK